MEVGEAFKNKSKSNYEIKLKAESESGWKSGGGGEKQLRNLRHHSAAHINSDLIFKNCLLTLTCSWILWKRSFSSL